MNAVMMLLYVAANLVIAVMLGCMLQSKFVSSAPGFRLVIALLAASAVGCMFVGLHELGEVAFGLPAALGFAQVAQTLFLALVLVLMRMRQVHEGEHTHPRQRGQVPPKTPPPYPTTIRLEGQAFSGAEVRTFLREVGRRGEIR